jgi:tRNA/tmRNA/rRNA uracil-C5-methylase (TrmA/RlmC/RlmD family)
MPNDDSDPVSSTAAKSDAKVPSKKRKNQNKSKKKVPVKGDPDYLSPTQLRNRRKRRAKQEKSPSSSTAKDHDVKSKGDGYSSTQRQVKRYKSIEDPSMKYIANPKNAPVVKAAKTYFQSIESKLTSKKIDFQVHLGPLYEWRTVSKLAVRASNSKVAIGLFLPQSHTLLPVPNNKAHHPSINKVVKCVTRACHEVGIEPYKESSIDQTRNSGTVDFNVKGRGQLRYIGVNIERKTGAAQLTLVWNSTAPKTNDVEDPHLNKLVKKILSMASSSDTIDGGPAKKRRRRGNREGKSKEDSIQIDGDKISNSKASDSLALRTNEVALNLHSIWINYNLSWKHSNAIFAYDSSCWKHVHGPLAIVEHLSFDNEINNASKAYAKPAPSRYPIPLHFPPNVFRQANLDAFRNIVGRIRERVITLGQGWDHLPSCVELFGGVGTIGLNLSDIVSSLVSSDENPNNLKCFNDSVCELPSDIGSRLEYKQKNATDMVRTETALFKQCEVLVVDPPRKGLDQEVVDYLCRTGYKSLKLAIYVSCGFQAFQRDCNAILNSGNWKLEFAEGYLLFPGSDAIETLAFFVPSK